MPCQIAHGLLDPVDARDTIAWDNAGFSLDASVCIAGQDRAGPGWLALWPCREPSFNARFP